MSQKGFFKAFNILYLSVKDVLNIYQKENFYRLLFKDVYALAGDGLYDDDSIRKRTSGNDTIHLKAIKKLHTVEGFEVLDEIAATECNYMDRPVNDQVIESIREI